MKKTLTVNLNGTVFHIDEDAYELLDNYLSSLKLYFRSQQGGSEIVDDIECRIAELFAEKIDTGRSVIIISDVEHVIKQMGKPEEFAQETTTESTDGKEESDARERVEYRSARRLYRDPDDKIIGGVFGGLAAYTGWDATLIRLVSFFLIFFSQGIIVDR